MKLVNRKEYLFIGISLVISLLAFVISAEKRNLIIQNSFFACMVFAAGAVYFGGVLKVVYKFFRYKIFRIFIKSFMIIDVIAIIFSIIGIILIEPTQMFISSWMIIGTLTGINITWKWARKKLKLDNL